MRTIPWGDENDWRLKEVRLTPVGLPTMHVTLYLDVFFGHLELHDYPIYYVY